MANKKTTPAAKQTPVTPREDLLLSHEEVRRADLESLLSMVRTTMRKLRARANPLNDDDAAICAAVIQNSHSLCEELEDRFGR